MVVSSSISNGRASQMLSKVGIDLPGPGGIGFDKATREIVWERKPMRRAARVLLAS